MTVFKRLLSLIYSQEGTFSKLPRLRVLMTTNCSIRLPILVLGQAAAAMIKTSKNCEGMIFKPFNHKAMTTMAINGKLECLMQSLRNVPE